jgi:hypothetical protein
MHPLTKIILSDPRTIADRAKVIAMPKFFDRMTYFRALARYHADVANLTRPYAWRFKQSDIRRATIEAHQLTLDTLEIT